MLAANRRASPATISRDEVEVFMGIVLDGPWPKKNDPARVAMFGGCPVCHENHGHCNFRRVFFPVTFWRCAKHGQAWETPQKIEAFVKGNKLDRWKAAVRQEGYTPCEPSYPDFHGLSIMIGIIASEIANWV